MDVKNLVEGYFYMLDPYGKGKLCLAIYLGKFSEKWPQLVANGISKYCFAYVYVHEDIAPGQNRIGAFQALPEFEVEKHVYEMHDLPPAISMHPLVGETRQPVLSKTEQPCTWPDCDCDDCYKQVPLE